MNTGNKKAERPAWERQSFWSTALVALHVFVRLKGRGLTLSLQLDILYLRKNLLCTALCQPVERFTRRNTMSLIEGLVALVG